jgi:hypothetical protein
MLVMQLGPLKQTSTEAEPRMVTERLFTVSQHEETSDDYYTSPTLFANLGLEFDLDVAAPPGGVSWIPAKKFYTMEDDGLSQIWKGRVWMNPPFSEVTPWVERFIAHGNGVGLVPIVRSKWLTTAWRELDGFGILENPHDMKFIRNGKPTTIWCATAIISMGAENVKAAKRLGPTR